MKQAVEPFPLAVLVIVCVLFCGVMFFAGGCQLYRDHLFATQGVHVQGRVERKFMQPFRDRHGNIQYTPEVVYWYPIGRLTGTTERQVREETWYGVTVGGPIPITYRRDNPAISRIDLAPEAAAIRRGIALALIFGSFGLVFGVWATRFYARRNQLYARLVSQGIRCTGRVTSIAETRQFRGGTQRWLTLRFTTANGEHVEGRTGSLNWKQYSIWREGDGIAVWYDPQSASNFTVNLDQPLHAATAEA